MRPPSQMRSKAITLLKNYFPFLAAQLAGYVTYYYAVKTTDNASVDKLVVYQIAQAAFAIVLTSAQFVPYHRSLLSKQVVPMCMLVGLAVLVASHFYDGTLEAKLISAGMFFAMLCQLTLTGLGKYTALKYSSIPISLTTPLLIQHSAYVVALWLVVIAVAAVKWDLPEKISNENAAEDVMRILIYNAVINLNFMMMSVYDKHIIAIAGVDNYKQYLVALKFCSGAVYAFFAFKNFEAISNRRTNSEALMTAATVSLAICVALALWGVSMFATTFFYVVTLSLSALAARGLLLTVESKHPAVGYPLIGLALFALFPWVLKSVQSLVPPGSHGFLIALVAPPYLTGTLALYYRRLVS